MVYSVGEVKYETINLEMSLILNSKMPGGKECQVCLTS